MATRISVTELLKRFDAGEFDQRDDGGDIRRAIDAGWYDWFCRDSSLLSKTRALMPKVRMLTKSNLVDTDNISVLFKNSCPLYGKLFDTMYVFDMATNEFLFSITPKSGFNSNFGMAIIQFHNDSRLIGPWTQVRKEFLALTETPVNRVANA